MNKPPTNDNHSKYPPPFSIRLNREERNELQKMADGLPLGTYIKESLFAANRIKPYLPRKPSQVDQKLFARLLGVIGQSRISQNINQLAKAANSGSLPVNKEVIKGLNDACEAIRWMRETLIRAMGLKPLSDPKNKGGRHDS